MEKKNEGAVGHTKNKRHSTGTVDLDFAGWAPVYGSTKHSYCYCYCYCYCSRAVSLIHARPLQSF